MPENALQIADPAVVPKRRSGNPAWGVKGINGVSGNPLGIGLSYRERKSRRDRVVAQIAVDVAGSLDALTFTDRLLLDKAVELLLGQRKSVEERSKALNAVARVTESIRRRQAKRGVARGGLTEYVHQKYGSAGAS
jgi:hypothetical protein